MTQNIGLVHHTERDASDSSVSVTRAYFAAHPSLPNTYVLSNSSGEAAAWLKTTSGTMKLDDDRTLEDRVPFTVSPSLVIL